MPGVIRRNFRTGMALGFLLGLGFTHIVLLFSQMDKYFVGQPVPQNVYPEPYLNESQEEDNQNKTEVVEESEEENGGKTWKILCWVLTHPKTHKTAIHVRHTWGKRCDKLLFMSTKADSELQPVVLNVTEGYKWLWGKTKAALKYIYDHHFEEADWFMKADDNTFVVVENLRHMLKEMDPTEPIYFGGKCLQYKFPQMPYPCGGGGYVFSKKALQKFVEEALPNKKKCQKGGKGTEDVFLADCLHNVGVTLEETRDGEGRSRFFQFSLEHHLSNDPKDKNYLKWASKVYLFPPKQGMECCSGTAVTFHDVSPNQMYVLEYLIYRLRAVGGSNSSMEEWEDEASFFPKEAGDLEYSSLLRQRNISINKRAKNRLWNWESTHITNLTSTIPPNITIKNNETVNHNNTFNISQHT